MKIDVTMFPAPAGINRDLRRLILLTTHVPRASGDKPNAGCERWTA